MEILKTMGMEKHVLDFVDSLTLQVIGRNNVTEIYINDRGFNGMSMQDLEMV